MLSAATGALVAAAVAAPRDRGQGAQSAALAAIIADYERFDRAEDPLASGQEGDREALARLPGITPADAGRRRAALEQFRTRLAAVSDEGLSPDERLNLVFLRWTVADRLDGLRFDDNRLGFTNEGGPEQLLGYIASSTVIRSREDAVAYISRLESCGEIRRRQHGKRTTRRQHRLRAVSAR